MSNKHLTVFKENPSIKDRFDPYQEVIRFNTQFTDVQRENLIEAFYYNYTCRHNVINGVNKTFNISLEHLKLGEVISLQALGGFESSKSPHEFKGLLRMVCGKQEVSLYTSLEQLIDLIYSLDLQEL